MTVARDLSEDEFLACFTEPMRDVTGTAERLLDIWPYVDQVGLPSTEVTAVHDIIRIYRDGRERFEQILFGTDVSDLFLVVVVDMKARTIRGHRWLDLRSRYGLHGHGEAGGQP